MCFLYFYGLIIFYIAFLSRKRGERGAFFNNLTNSLILIFSITTNLIIVNFFIPFNKDFIVFPFDILMLGFIIIFLPIFYLFIINEKRKIKKIKVDFKEIEHVFDRELPLKYDIYRKITHLVVLAIIFFYFILGFLIHNLFFYILRFLPPIISNVFYSIFTVEGDLMIFTQYLVIFLVGVSLFGLLTADFIRILKPKIYPLKPINQILREKELHSRLGPQISMAIGCFSIILLYGLFQPIGPIVICTSMTMSIFGDMASNLIGRIFGKRKIRSTKKSYEGLFSGVIIAFISGITILILLRDFYIINILGFFLLPLVGAIIIGILDYLDLEIDDNLSYPIIVSTILFFISLFIA